MRINVKSSLAEPSKLIYRVARLIERKKKVTFLVGSGISLGDGSRPGVPSTEEIIKLISARFGDEEGQRLFREAVCDLTGAAAYQAAMKLLVECEGQSGLNEVITEAVLQTHRGASQRQNDDVNVLQQYEDDLGAWGLNSAVLSLAQIYNGYPRLIGPLLTSNFDPLVGIAIRRLGGDVEVVPIAEDGSITRFQTADSQRRIIHFHGYWRGVDTLHTPDQIMRPRPKLAGDLRRLLNDTSLVVIGYGGWPDVFMETLTNIIAEGSVSGEFLWTFHEQDPELIHKKYSNLLERLQPQIGSRIMLYGGIDANTHLRELADRLDLRKSAAPENRQRPANFTSLTAGSASISHKYGDAFADPGCDPPPAPEYWTGRDQEMHALLQLNYRVCFITGIGGQGKSFLASAFLEALVKNENVAFWDWRDCREERNHMRTNLMNLCGRLSRGALKSEELKDVSDASLVESTFQLLGTTSAVFVFDNVDEYIDLKELVPTGLVKTVMDEALKRSHSARVIFTCRPNLSFIAPNFLQLAIQGFDTDECRELLSKYLQEIDEVVLFRLADRACSLTKGHPFWLNIIAAQAVISVPTAEAFMDDLEFGDAASSSSQSDALAEQMLGAVWQRLTDKQKNLLRGMGESVCEETKDQLARILKKEFSYAGVEKALKKLRQLNLVVVRPSEQGVEYFDLHPLVRRFVRMRGSREQRDKYIGMFVSYFESLIRAVRSSAATKTSFSNLKNWSYKIELEINRSSYASALATLQDSRAKLEESGYLEEYVRLAELVLGKIEWTDAAAGLPDLDRVACSLIEVLGQLGRYEEADGYLAKLAKVASSGVSYLWMCNAAALRYWYADDFLEAIRHARTGADLKRQSGADIHVEIEHVLALALRDTRIPEHVTEALHIFLKGNSLATVIAGASTEFHSMQYYGNIGRCLQFLQRHDDSMQCYRMSLEEERGREDYHTAHDKAYAFWWIGEVFVAKKEPYVAAHFFKLAQTIWSKTSPPLARKMDGLINGLEARHHDVAIVHSKGDIELRGYCESRLAEATSSPPNQTS